MPLLPGLLRRRGPSTEDMRRRSFYHTDSTTSNQGNASSDSRPSEQLPRTTSAPGLAPPTATDEQLSIAGRPSTEAEILALGRSVSPPVQEESNKHRRFSMLKFRHASESHLSKKAREHGMVPPIPPSIYIVLRPSLHDTDKHVQLQR